MDTFAHLIFYPNDECKWYIYFIWKRAWFALVRNVGNAWASSHTKTVIISKQLIHSTKSGPPILFHQAFACCVVVLCTVGVTCDGVVFVYFLAKCCHLYKLNDFRFGMCVISRKVDKNTRISIRTLVYWELQLQLWLCNLLVVASEVSLTHTPDLRVTDSVVTSMAYSGPFDALVTPQLLLKGGQHAGGSITGCGGNQTSITCNRHTHIIHIYRSQTGNNAYSSPGNKIVTSFNFKIEV